MSDPTRGGPGARAGGRSRTVQEHDVAASPAEPRDPRDRVRAPPRFPDIGLIALVPDRWGSRWVSRHHELVGLSEYFHVLWVDPPLHWRDRLPWAQAPSPGARLPAAPGFSVFPQEAGPPIGFRPAGLARAIAAYRLRLARRALVERGCRRIVLSIRRPELVGALDAVPHDLSCYHVDDEYSFSPTEQPISAEEAELLSRADRVFMLSEAMVERKGHLNPTTMQIPHGVDHAAYARPCPEPADLRSIPRPRIGYAGFVKHQLDWDLVEEIARRHPTWSIVFVGALSPQPGLDERIEPIARLENVHFLGSKDAGEIARYPQHFDVAIMPYRDDAYTRYIRPAKIPEYLAAGPPCVGTRIRPLEDFAEVVALATGPDEWSRRIAEALAEEPGDGESAERRRALALRFDWSHVVPTLAGVIAEGLGESLDP